MKLKKSTAILLGLVLCFVLLTGFALVKPLPVPRFTFIKPDHPVQMLNDKTGSWAYYASGLNVQPVVEKARTELLAKGYTEDFKRKPWFRFVNGSSEVIICGSGQVQWLTSPDATAHPIPLKLPKGSPEAMGTAILVHGPRLSGAVLLDFQFKKLVHGW